MKRKSWVFWSVLAAAVLLLGAAGATLGYGLYYADRALPGVSVLGEPVTGMDRAEVEDIIQDRVEKTLVKVSLDGDQSDVDLEKLGYTVNTPAMVDEAFAANQTLAGRFKALNTQVDVQPSVTFDPDKFTEYTEELAEKVGSPATNASVMLDEDTNTFVVTPGSSGTTLNAEALASAAEESAETLDPGEVTLEVATVKPAVTTASAEKVAKAANSIVESAVELTTILNVYSPDEAEKASWVQLPEAFTGEPIEGEPDQTLTTDVTIDDAKVTRWVEETTSASNDEPVPGLRNINSRGDVVQVVTEGESGWEANNTKELVEDLLAVLPQGEGFTAQIQYDEVKTDEWEEQLIADGAEDLAYQAAKGEKWIDIDLSNFTTTAYEGATVVRGPVSMVPGAPGTETVTGKYEVWAKVATQTMRGDNLDGTKYETPDVPWILYFHGGYALHGAYWRSSFGYGGSAGSHGCVNMPVSEAKWFYDWASVGTPVVSHY